MSRLHKVTPRAGILARASAKRVIAEARREHDGNPKRPWKKAAFTEWGNKGERQTMRTKRYRYTERWQKSRVIVELYDHDNDLWETVNLAGDPAQSATLPPRR